MGWDGGIRRGIWAMLCSGLGYEGRQRWEVSEYRVDKVWRGRLFWGEGGGLGARHWFWGVVGGGGGGVGVGLMDGGSREEKERKN